MSNQIYNLWKQELLKGAPNNLLNSAEGENGVFAALVDTGVYTFSHSHQFYNSLVGVVSTDQEILSKTQAQGVFHGADVTYTSVVGATVEAIVLYRKNAGANTTWPLIAYLDSGANLPATPNNGNVTIAWAESGIFGI